MEGDGEREMIDMKGRSDRQKRGRMEKRKGEGRENFKFNSHPELERTGKRTF